MPHNPGRVFPGFLVQFPMNPLFNAGFNRCPGIITRVIDAGSEGVGATVRARPFLNVFSFDFAILELAFGAFQVTCCMYEEEARAEGFTGAFGHIPLGCWPVDGS
jgi:hypothetical protein